MKKTTITVALLILSLNIFGQQDPLISHYFFLKETFNPAYAGFEEEICANLLSHQQWRKFDNAPMTTFLSVSSPLNLFNQRWGIGLNFVDDRYGFVRDFRGNIAISFQRNIGNGKISLGINPGIFNKKFKPNWKFPDQTEPILYEDASAIIFDIGTGIYYSTENLFAGISSMHFLKPKFYFEAKDQGGTENTIAIINHLYFTTGYKLTLANEILNITPSLLIKTDANKMQIDINIYALYNKKIWASVTYRNKSALVFFIGTSYFNNIKIGLSYDLSLNYLNKVTYGTFEAYIGYSFSFMKIADAKKYRNVKTL